MMISHKECLKFHLNGRKFNFKELSKAGVETLLFQQAELLRNYTIFVKT